MDIHKAWIEILQAMRDQRIDLNKVKPTDIYKAVKELIRQSK